MCSLLNITEELLLDPLLIYARIFLLHYTTKAVVYPLFRKIFHLKTCPQVVSREGKKQKVKLSLQDLTLNFGP